MTSAKRVVDVANQVVHILQTDGETEETLMEPGRIQVLPFVVFAQ